MREFGEYLKNERESRNITLKDIALETKIRLDYLEAIEKGEFSRLPGEFYSRTYVRAYAKAIGLEEDVVLEKYRSFVTQVDAEGETESVPVDKKWEGTLQSTVASKGEAPRNKLGRRIVLALFIVALLIVGAIFVLDYLGLFDQNSENSTSLDLDPQVISQTLDNNTTEIETPIEDLEPEKDELETLDDRTTDKLQDTLETVQEEVVIPLEVSLKASGDCWYEIRAVDGTLIRTGFLQNQQEVSVSRNEPLKVLLGKPDVITLVINGHIAGVPKDVREFVIDSSGEINILNRW